LDILPAIDLKEGKAVRLTKGLMDSAKIYSDEPWQLAKAFEEMGSKWLHLVDLNGAFAGEPKNLEQIEKIRKNCGLKMVNVPFTVSIAEASGVDTIASGGVRDMGDIRALLETGKVAGVIVGKAYYEGTLDLAEAFRVVYG